MAGDAFALLEQLENAWRPLSPGEQVRAQYWLDRAAARVRRRWPDVDARVDAGALSVDDVVEVVVVLVVGVLAAADAPAGATQIQVGSGAESRSVTLADPARLQLPPFEPWMVDQLDATAGSAGPRPLGEFPPGGIDRLFDDPRRLQWHGAR